MVDILDSVKAYLDDTNNNDSNNDKLIWNEINNNSNDNNCNDKVINNTLWQRIKSMTKEVEWDEIELIIGNDIVENNEMLYNEVKVLRSALKDLEDRNMKRIQSSVSSCLYGETQLHQMLKSEIAILANKLPENDLGRQTPRDREIIEYALSNESNSRPNSSSLNRIRHASVSSLRTHSRPVSAVTRTSSGLSIRSDNNFRMDYSVDEIQTYQSKLNVLDIHEVLNDIRNAFYKEKEYLLKWIEYLHECINELDKDKNDSQNTPIIPTVTELREFGHVLRDRVETHRKNSARLKKLEKLNTIQPRLLPLNDSKTSTVPSFTHIKAPPRGKLKPVRPSTARQVNISPLLKRKLVRKRSNK